MNKLKGRVVAITGAGSGIGRALAIECAQLGAHIAISDVNAEGLKETESLCTQKGANVLNTTLDVSDRDAVEQWAKAVYEHFGEVNVIINNAGVNLSASIETMAYDDFEWLMNINFWGVVYGTKAFLPYIKQADWGHITNISSVFGLISIPNQSAYNSAKYAVRGFTEALRMELEMTDTNIGVSTVHPGGIKTNIVNNSVIKDVVGKQQTQEEAKQEFNERLARTSAESAAKTIIRGIKNNKSRVMVGWDAQFIEKVSRIIPVKYQSLVKMAAK